MKTCSTCKKPSSDFSPDKRSTDGLASRCRSCRRDISRGLYHSGHPDVKIPEYIQCSKCERTLSSSLFYADKRRLTGKQSQCSFCQKGLVYRRSVDNPENFLLKSARIRSRNKGVPFNITVEDITIPATCPVLGIPLEKGKGKRTDNSPTLDRIIPELGYVPGNIAVISWRANNLKSDGTLEELERICKWMKTQR